VEIAFTGDLRRALRLYVIVPRCDGLAEEALAGGATAVQLRAKDLSGRALYAEACALVRLCARYGALCIVNDRLDVALAAAADGVHLGADDLPLDRARAVAGPGFLIGASAGTVAEAEEAVRRGADYLGVGTVWPTSSKGDAGPPIGVDGLRAIVQVTSLPVVGIGGITVANAALVRRAGAAGVAVIQGVLGDPNPREAASRLRAVVDGEG